MGKYENGIMTRRAILDAGRELFYRQGFRETASADICRAAHVNRNALYYHFKDMEALRYEVLWEFFIGLRRDVEAVCQDQELHTILAMYALWSRFLEDANFRRFHADYFADYPIYDPTKGPGLFFRTTYEKMYGRYASLEQIDPLSFASVYGYLVGMILLANTHSACYTARELFESCVKSGMMIWGISRNTAEELLIQLRPYYERLTASG